MSKRGAPIVSPCIDVCDYGKRGLCKGCCMTKPEKKALKRVPGERQEAFLGELLSRFAKPKRYARFLHEYRKKCSRNGSAAGARSLDALDRALAAQEDEAA